MRTRAFVQDDAHIFCAEDQVEGEVARFCALLRRCYAEYGFGGFEVGFSTRPARRAGDDAAWDRAEAALAAAARAAGLDCRVQPGEGAFYGPKLEFILRDGRGRRWQCGTVQLDFVLPERLDVSYVDAQDRAVRPAMIHHAVLGSLERFVGILLEHHEGRLPLWLAPEQVAVVAVDPAQAGYAAEVAAALSAAGLRAPVDARDERLSRKIADAHDAAVPVVAVVGAREAAARAVALRRRGGARATMPLAEAVAVLAAEARPGA